jgi:hypothetical protein
MVVIVIFYLLAPQHVGLVLYVYAAAGESCLKGWCALRTDKEAGLLKELSCLKN